MADTVATPANIENVLIRAGACSVAVLPQFGGKISSIRVGEQELLQQPLAPLASRTRSMTFDAGDASGWDECLPSVAGCRVNTESGQAEIPDHGDLWRVEWEQQASRISIQGVEGKPDSSITLIGKCFSLPLEIKRKLELVQSGKCWDLKIQYTLSNRSSSAVPWSWAAHPLFSVQEGDRIVLPDSVNTLRLEGSGGERLGKGVSEHGLHQLVARYRNTELLSSIGVIGGIFDQAISQTDATSCDEQPSPIESFHRCIETDPGPSAQERIVLQIAIVEDDVAYRRSMLPHLTFRFADSHAGGTGFDEEPAQ